MDAKSMEPPMAADEIPPIAAEVMDGGLRREAPWLANGARRSPLEVPHEARLFRKRLQLPHDRAVDLDPVAHLLLVPIQLPLPR